jgi:DNA-binding NarL/FixJ family response regulator
MEKISVFLVDDHKLFREGLRMLLHQTPFVSEVYEAADGIEFLSRVGECKPDIVFMDINMPQMNGVETTAKASELLPDLKIVALSMFADEEYYTNMIDAGACGFMLKNSGIEDVEECIRSVVSGHNYFSHEILSGIVKNLSKKKKSSRKSELSEREEEVLFSICQGHSNQEIAEKLNLSKRTIDKHRENLLLKTGSRNTAGLVMYAIRHGLAEV